MPQLVSTGQLTINDYNDGMTVYLSNEGMSLPADSAGLVTSYDGASTTLFIFLGQVDDSASWTVTATPSSGVAGSLGSGAAVRTYTVTSLTFDSAYVDISATKPGFISVSRRFSLSRARGGLPGQDGVDGTPGTPGNDGLSAKKAYAASATATTSTAPAATTGADSVPGVNQGGIVGTWQLAVPSIASGQYIWATDGSYSSLTNQITWGVPYWSSLRVGKLSTIHQDTGTLNISEGISSSNGNFSVDSAGLATFKSLNILGAGGNTILTPTDTTIKIGGLPNEVKNTEANFTPIKTWEFRQTAEGIVAGASTVAINTDSITQTATGADPFIYFNGLAIDGRIYNKVRMRVRRSGGSTWEGALYWSNSTHAFDQAYKLVVPNTVTSVYTIIEWDLSTTADWNATNIDGVRFDLGTSTGDAFEIDWISVGKMGPTTTMSSNTNLTDTTWWKRDATIQWNQNLEFNRIIMTGTDCASGGPKGTEDTVWFAEEIGANASANGGGWGDVYITVDPTKTYRFAVPVKKLAGTGQVFWGTRDVAEINTTVFLAGNNPYFIPAATIDTGKWYLMVGYLFPAGSTGNVNTSAGIWDCTTGAKVGSGINFNQVPGTTRVSHRAYQFYGTLNSQMIFGRPMVNLVDGTEPALREYFSATAVLNSQQMWSDVTGTGRPADNATVGADRTNLDIGLSSNLLYNSLPNNSLTYSATAAMGDHGQVLEGGGVQLAPRGHALDIYSPFRHCAYIHIATVTPTSGTYQDIQVNPGDKIPIVAGRRYEISGYLSVHRATAFMRVAWYTTAGVFISENNIGATVTTGLTYTAGETFPRPGAFVTAPATAYYAGIIIRQTHNGGADPYTFFSCLYFGEALPSQTVLTPWTDGVPVSVRNIGYTGDLNASADLVLTADGVTITGNTITKATGTSAWNAQAYSKVGYTGGAFATATVPNINFELMFGLDIDPVANGSTYTGIDFAIYLTAAEAVYAYESGVITAQLGTYAVGDTFTVKYDGSNVTYEKNGSVIRTKAAVITVPLFFDSSFSTVGSYLTNVRFGPLSSNAWTAVGGAGKPADNATSDITLIGRGTTITGNKITNGTGSAWTNDAYSKEGYIGGAYASGSPGQYGSNEIFFGLDTNPTEDRTYLNIDYAFYITATTVRIYESGTDRGQVAASYAAGDIFTVVYDGTYINYYQNSTRIRGPILASVTIPIHFDSSFNGVGAVLNNVRFGPMTNGAWQTNGYTENGIGHVVRPSGGSISSNAAVTGALEILFPTNAYYSSTMLRMRIEIYEYSTGKSCSYVISGYNYGTGPAWLNCTAEYTGPPVGRKRVRFGNNTAATRNSIWIGETDTVWQYPQIRITEITAGFQNFNWSTWSSGWNMAFVTTLAGVVRTEVTTPSVGGAMTTIDQLTPANVATFIAPNTVGNAQFGGDLFSSNWNGQTGTGGAGWYLERTGNFYGYNIKVRGAIMGGVYDSYAWPAAGAGNTGFYLGSPGLLLGNANNNRYFQVTSDGNIYAPQFSVENGSAKFSGILQVGTTAAGSLSSITPTIGTLRARTTGGRTEIADDIIRVYDASNNLRVKIGYLL